MTNKMCPFKFLRETGGTECDGELCALWEVFTGTCALATAAYLAGRDELRKERRAERNGN